MSKWIQHDSNDPPELAPAALIVPGWDRGRLGPTQTGGVSTVKAADWHGIEMYRPLTDEDGISYCSAEGLEPWAEYVVTQKENRAQQATRKPFLNQFFGWMFDGSTWLEYAPNTHRHPGDWNDSLMRVWRE